jgi:hypothetical protein
MLQSEADTMRVDTAAIGAGGPSRNDAPAGWTWRRNTCVLVDDT